MLKKEGQQTEAVAKPPLAEKKGGVDNATNGTDTK
jgi:hypothetical protein